MTDLDVTDDELRDLTPVADLAEEILAAVDGRVLLSAELRAAFDAVTEAVAARLARQLEQARHAAMGTPRRLAALEAARQEVDAWRLRVAGVDERNGRLGRIDAAIADLRADLGTEDERRTELAELAALRADLGTTKDRERERKVVSAIRWTTAKVLALLGAAGLAAGGGVVATLRARAAMEAVDARHAGALDAHERAQDESIGRLFDLCTATSRTQ